MKDFNFKKGTMHLWAENDGQQAINDFLEACILNMEAKDRFFWLGFTIPGAPEASAVPGRLQREMLGSYFLEGNMQAGDDHKWISFTADQVEGIIFEEGCLINVELRN